MASKIFMGDMSLLENILKNLNNDFYSLYSCAVVSRHWCKVSIPILWQDPFSFEPNSLFIFKYFSSLGEDEKFVLKELGTYEDEFFSKTLFDYARFLKVLDLFRLNVKARDLRYQLGVNSYRIMNWLIKIFIESGATLHKLDLYCYFYSDDLDWMSFYSLLEQIDQFFLQLQDLSLRAISTYSSENAIKFLISLTKKTTKISTLNLSDFNSNSDPQILQALINLIKSQEQIKRFSIFGESSTEFHGVISSLECQTNSLQEVIIESCDYSEEFEVLRNCKNLEILRMRDSNYPELLNLLNCEINTLEIEDSEIEASIIVQTLEKSGLSLQQLKLKSNVKIMDESLLLKAFKEDSLLLEAIKSFCPNITYLNITYTKISTHLVDLISNLQKLQFLTLQYNVDMDYMPEKDPMIRVKQFAKILPLTLQYLDLSESTWLNPYIDILLNYCDAPLKKLLIDDLNNEKSAKALIEFCIRKRTLNYVTLRRWYNLDDHNFSKTVEAYVTLTPFERIVVDC
ncbi:hypothetical protein F8M41_000065 [Gigaspora margarita]|uniref:F-box domain-containing protein n=1 Tax=Gigaspora margarita TaxID=4874 RepID=A0A8H4B5G9_GIGMA|nr:hypothetical protein F8M41_000065 [Gigaspora margarita]